MDAKETKKPRTIINNLLAGIAVFVPLVITLFVLKIGLSLAQQIFGLLPFLDPNNLIGGKIGTALRPLFGIILTFAVIMAVGAIARNYAGKRFVSFAENMITKIPFIRTVYQGSKQLLETLLKSSKTSFRKVALIEYPRKGIYSIGFVTGQVQESVQKPIQEKSYYVFVPTTPNPTQGFLLVVPEKEVIPLNVDVEEAFKSILSVGLATSEENEQKVKL